MCWHSSKLPIADNNRRLSPVRPIAMHVRAICFMVFFSVFKMDYYAKSHRPKVCHRRKCLYAIPHTTAHVHFYVQHTNQRIKQIETEKKKTITRHAVGRPTRFRSLGAAQERRRRLHHFLCVGFTFAGDVDGEIALRRLSLVPNALCQPQVCRPSRTWAITVQCCNASTESECGCALWSGVWVALNVRSWVGALHGLISVARNIISSCSTHSMRI